MGIFDKLFSKKKTTDKVGVDTNNSDSNSEAVLKILQEQKQKYQETANGMIRKEPVSDQELMKYFVEYFAPNKEFYSSPGSPKFQAYFNSINKAKLEMLNSPSLYNEATGRRTEDLLAMINNPDTAVTNIFVCGLIFCMGKYAVIKQAVFCVDFLQQLPNCIALYLLLIAQKEPAKNRTQLLDTGDGVDPEPLKAVIDSLHILDPAWDPKIF